MLGTRGVPASYSGFETCVEELGSRLVERGHEVSVYCRSHHIDYPGTEYRGMRLIKLPTIQNKYLDTIVHTFLSSVHALRQRFDVALYFIAGNSVATWIPRMVGTRTILNVDGLDWKRDKWPAAAKSYIRLAEWLATKWPNVYLTDSRAVQEYYRERYGSAPAYIPYGSDIQRALPGETLRRLGLEARSYILFVGRLVPENRADHLVDAYRGLDTKLRCVIVGDAPYSSDYIDSLKARAEGDPRVLFTGYVFGEGYRELGSNAAIFVETSEVGGTHPALLEAMAFGNCVVVNDTAANLETIGNAGLSYRGNETPGSLRAVLRALLDDPKTVRTYRQRAFDRARSVYSWEAVVADYEHLMRRTIAG